MSEKVTFASVIGNRGFRFLWFNQILVQLAYNTLNFTLIIWVFKLVGSNLAVSALMMAVYLPVIIFGIFAGVFVDIADRRKIILAIDLLLAISFFLFIFIRHSFPLILLNTFLVNSLAQFFMPSESSSIPLLVNKKQLFLANSLFSLTLYGAFMIGFSVGGPILNNFGINAVFFLGVAELLLAFVLARNLPVIQVPYKLKKIDNSLFLFQLKKVLDLTFKEAKETFRFIKGSLEVTTAIALLSAIQGVIGMLAVLMPSYLERVLHIHATDASYFLMLPLGLGMVVGAYVIGRVFQHWPRRSLVIPSIIIAGALFVLIGIVPTIANILQSADLPSYITHPRYFFRAPSLSSFFAVLAFLLGFCAVSVIIPTQTVLQESTTEKNRGKIFAVLAVVMTSVSALPVILVGGLADLFGVTPILTVLGVMALIVGLLASKPSLFFREAHLSLRIRQFLGLGHWQGKR